MARFHLGRLPGPKEKVAKPDPPPTFEQFLQLVEESRLSSDEAKVVCCRLIRHTREWQRPTPRENPKFYRQPTPAEAAEVEQPS